MKTLTPVEALDYLKQYGFMGVRSGPIEFHMARRSKFIVIQDGQLSSRTTERDFLRDYSHRNFAPIDTADVGQ